MYQAGDYPNEPVQRLEELIRRFGTIEEETYDSMENDDCERHFKATYARSDDGRFVVHLPFREDMGSLGESRNQAEKRFKALENRLDRNSEMKKVYSDFIHEYLDLGHAKILNKDKTDVEGAHYLPRH